MNCFVCGAKIGAEAHEVFRLTVRYMRCKICDEKSSVRAVDLVYRCNLSTAGLFLSNLIEMR